MKTNIWKCTGVMVLVGMLIAIATVAGATQDKGDKSRKDGILLVAFGTSETNAKVSFDNIHRLAAKRFKSIPIRWAYTSDIIRRKLAKQGTEIDSPMVALAKMHDEGFTHVAVQSLHTIAGAEYDELKDTVSIFQKGSEAFDKIVLGRPLLWSFADMKQVVKAMLKEVPASRKKNEIVVLMGHGSEHHPGDLAYTAAAWMFQQADPLVFLG
ncbi:MAG: sirohydrochlorin cobaltochelatase, partial [Thermodesulfobacteriota bacterium]|nr:sirohydrochlorin cobaltochelatase [Thermodesulfobacteriota bacterium]